jgi:hypothetical protein
LAAKEALPELLETLVKDEIKRGAKEQLIPTFKNTEDLNIDWEKTVEKGKQYMPILSAVVRGALEIE